MTKKRTIETIKYNAANWSDGEVTAKLDRRPLIGMEYIHVTTHCGAKHTIRVYHDGGKAEMVTSEGTEINAVRVGHGGGPQTQWVAEAMGVERWGDCPIVATLQVYANI